MGLKIRYIQIIFLFSGIITLNSLFLISTILFPSSISFATILLFASVIVLLILIIVDIKKSGIKTYNYFSIFYLLGLLFYCYPISKYQTVVSFLDIYYFLFGPLILIFILYCNERCKFNKIDFKLIKLNPNHLFIIFFIIFILVKTYIYYKVGFRLFSFKAIGVPFGDQRFVVPGFTGISNILQYSFITFFPFVKNRYKILIIITIIISASLIVKRGDIIRLLFFLITYFSYLKFNANYKFNSSLIVLLFCALIIIFFIAGEIRHNVLGNSEFNISNQVSSNLNNQIIDGIFAYTSFNFEVLKTYYNNNDNYTFIPYSLFFPIANVIGFKDKIQEYYSSLWYKRINGFNAATFLSNFIYDSGPLYFIGIIIYSIIIGAFIIISRIFYLEGAYLYILTFIGFNIFGNYLISPQIFYGLLFSIFINFIIDRKKISYIL